MITLHSQIHTPEGWVNMDPNGWVSMTEICNLSDRELEDRVDDSISFSKFCGLSLEDSVPDHSIVSRSRTMMTEAKAWEDLIAEVNAQMDRRGLLVKQGAIVDATITESPRKPKGKPNYEEEDD